MKNRPLVFLDTSAIISAVFSKPNSTSRSILLLGQQDLIDLYTSQYGLAELEAVIRARSEDLLPDLAELLDLSNVRIVANAPKSDVSSCVEMTGYRPDAKILAAAITCNADYLVTLDKKHLLGNPLIGPPYTPCRIGTPSECIQWLSSRLVEAND